MTDAVFIVPGLLIYVVFLIIPIMMCFFYSITNWDGIRSSYSIIGIDNFKELMVDADFWSSIKTTFIFTMITTVIYIVLGLTIAVILDNKSRAYNFAKIAIFLPVVLSSVVVSFIWSYMVQTNGGVFNYLLGFIGVEPINYYASKDSILLMVALTVSWAGLGFFVTVFTATLKTIPDELYESGKIDGAGTLKKFTYITLPLMTPGITINTVFSVVWGLKQYDQMKIMTPNIIQTVTIYSIEKAFDFNRLSYSSASILVLFIMIVFVTVFQMKVLKRFEVNY